MSTPDEPTPRSQRQPATFPVVVPKSGLPVFAPVAASSAPRREGPTVAEAHAAPDALAAYEHSPAPPTRTHARVWVGVLTVASLALATFAAYLWVINTQWQQQNDELRVSVAELEGKVESSAAQVADLQSELLVAQANLDGATGRVTDLADTSANARDQVAFLTELADSFQQCSQAQETRIAHLQDASSYTAASLAAEGRDVKKYCDGVIDTYTEFLTTVESH